MDKAGWECVPGQPARHFRKSSSTSTCLISAGERAGGPGNPGRQSGVCAFISSSRGADEDADGGLSRLRVDIDMIKFSGSAFAKLTTAWRVGSGGPGIDRCRDVYRAGEVVQPAEVIYNKTRAYLAGKFPSGDQRRARHAEGRHGPVQENPEWMGTRWKLWK